MKGIVFTEFLEMIEQEFGEEQVDDLLDASDLPSGGAYTSVGTYDYQEMMSLVEELSNQTGLPTPQLIHAYGKYLFQRFATHYPQFYKNTTSTFVFLKSVEDHIHVEVRKLYPEATLPSFEYEDTPDGGLQMTYSSARPFADLAHGLIEGCTTHFGEPIQITRKNLPAESGVRVRFTLTKTNHTSEAPIYPQSHTNG